MTRPTGKSTNRIGLVGALWRQLVHSRVVSLLLVFSIGGVSALSAYVGNSARFHNRSIQLIMKDTGHNLWFLHRDANLLDAVAGLPRMPDFDEERIQQLAADRDIASTYWGNVLQARTTVLDREVLLTGYQVIDDHQVTEEKAHLLEPLPPAHAALGHTLAVAWSLSPGDPLTINSRQYLVQSVHAPNGTMDDARLWVPLADAQEILGRPGRANLMLGFLCMRGRSLEAGIAALQKRMAEKHDDLQVVPLMNLLNARALTRLTTTRYLGYLKYLALAVSALLLAVAGWMEVNQRRYELALMSAMGASRSFLVFFFLAKLLLLSLVAGLAGFLAGSAASVRWLAPVLVTHTRQVAVVWSDLPSVMLPVMIMIVLAAVIPLVYIVRLEPARVLAEE